MHSWSVAADFLPLLPGRRHFPGAQYVQCPVPDCEEADTKNKVIRVSWKMSLQVEFFSVITCRNILNHQRAQGIWRYTELD